MTDTRQQEAASWLNNTLGLPVTKIEPLAGDASFRRYFRVYLPDGCLVLMDAPPAKENCKPYLAIGAELLKHRIHTPTIIAENLEQGFLLLEDFGDQLFLTALKKEDNTKKLYHKALQTLVKLQQIKTVTHHQLPVFDTAMMLREMQLFSDWFIEGKLEYKLQEKEKKLLLNSFKLIADKIESFQYTCVHRDYHSRNLMLLESGELGVLDFQDAVLGPITYDAISLLKDCYIDLSRDKVLDLLGYYHHLLGEVKLIDNQSFYDFTNEFDWVGIQRHLKVVGIFSRLDLRDHKTGYLKDIPLAMRYLMEALNEFSELKELSTWIKTTIYPLYEEIFELRIITI